jgi:hypothetical protein
MSPCSYGHGELKARDLRRMVVAPGRERSRNAAPHERHWSARFRRAPSGRTVLLGLVGIAALSALLRVALVAGVHAPVVFSDELGYAELARSIGRTGHLALLNQRGLSYSPLYAVVLSPIYAFGVSAPTAYTAMKIANALLISLSVFPIYKIARFALPRRTSLLVAAVSTLAPLMFYSSYTMSENLAYPLCLTAIWAMLESVRAPSARSDAVLLGTIFLACVTRVQLVVLVPAALTAVFLAAVLGPEDGVNVGRSLIQALRRHWLLLCSLAGAFLPVLVRGFVGEGVFSIAGRYDIVGRSGFPDAWPFIDQFARHLAGVDLALGVVPFVGAIVAAIAFARSRFPRGRLPFAAVAVSVTTWMLVEVAWEAALFDGPHGDVPRIHERFLIYVVPLFLTALFATIHLDVSARLCLGAVAFAALLPVVIPFHTVVNQTIGADTFGLHPFARPDGGRLVAISHVTLAAILAAAVLGLVYVRLRSWTQGLVLLVLIPFALTSYLTRDRIESASAFTRSLLPRDHRDWVDAVSPRGDVILISGLTLEDRPALETAYNNNSITRLYYVCVYTAGSEFGERQVTIDRSGRLRGPAGYLKARYVVAPASLHIRGTVLTRNRSGREVLVAPEGSRVKIPPARRGTILKKCKSS